jgi:hypothetical protein
MVLGPSSLLAFLHLAFHSLGRTDFKYKTNNTIEKVNAPWLTCLAKADLRTWLCGGISGQLLCGTISRSGSGPSAGCKHGREHPTDKGNMGHVNPCGSQVGEDSWFWGFDEPLSQTSSDSLRFGIKIQSRTMIRMLAIFFFLA